MPREYRLDHRLALDVFRDGHRNLVGYLKGASVIGVSVGVFLGRPDHIGGLMPLGKNAVSLSFIEDRNVQSENYRVSPCRLGAKQLHLPYREAVIGIVKRYEIHAVYYSRIKIEIVWKMWCRMLDIVPLIRMILGSSAYPMAKIVVAGSVDCVGGQKILIGVFKVSAREEIQKITRIKHHKIVLFGVITCLFKILECVIEVLKSTSLVALVIKRYMYVGYMKKFQLVSETYIKRCFYYLKLLHVFIPFRDGAFLSRPF
jgi:hypothetical protein